MINDPVVNKIQYYRNQHAEKYEHDLEKICAALREKEKNIIRKQLLEIQDCCYHKQAANKVN